MAESEPARRPVILVAEDEPGIREALELLLGLEGFGVVTATNGAQALELLARVECDLVITDHMMPVMDGIALLMAIRADPRLRGLPSILMSAAPRPPESVPALAARFISKPFEIPRLLDAIGQLLDGRSG